MNACALTASITAIANRLACQLSLDELELLGVSLTQLGRELQYGKQWSFFRTSGGKASYHTKCLRRIHGCKQSWRVKTLICLGFAKSGDRSFSLSAKRSRRRK